MKLSRRHFLAPTLTSVGALHLGAAPVRAASNTPPAGRSTRLRLGLVTYNLAKAWDVPTLIKHCEQTGFAGVELRTTHAHGVEVGLSPEQRREVRQRFRDSRVELMGLGSAFDYHTPDPAQLRRDIEATKQYLQLAHEVGATGVKVRPNAFPKEVPREQTLEQIGRSLRELGEFGAGLGQQIRLEVHGAETCLLPNIRRILDLADHPNVGACWNSNQDDLKGEGFEHNFDLVQSKIFSVHMRDLFLEEYPWRRLLERLRDIGFSGFCMAEIPESPDPIRVMRYYAALFRAYQGLQ